MSIDLNKIVFIAQKTSCMILGSYKRLFFLRILFFCRKYQLPYEITSLSDGTTDTYYCVRD